MNSLTTLYLIRHGETLWNQEARYQGQMDVELSGHGRLQADRLAGRMQTVPLDAIYASDLKRAFQTAETIDGYHSLGISAETRLRETSWGEWEGRTREQVRRDYPALFSERYRNRGQYRVPGAELPGEVQKRVMSVLEEIVRHHSGETVAVVSHGGALRLVFCTILQLDYDQAFRIRIYNTALSIVKANTNGRTIDWKIQCLNDIDHLNPREVIGD